MSADADHEVIDSPEALLRHLYEEHGVEEARDLDPETAPVQFWVRRHAELERAQWAARRDDEPPPPSEPWLAPESRGQPERRAQPESRGQPAGPFQREARPPPEVRAQPEVRPQPASPTQPEARREPGRPEPGGAGREGRRLAGFGDPLVEAMARALAGRGHDEAAVRAAIRSFPGSGGGPAGEAAVRAVLVEPMLRSAAERLLGVGGSRQPASRPSQAVTPAAPPPKEEPAWPEAAWAGLWSDLADPGRRPVTRAGPADDDGDDLMAVANAVQQRRRVKRRRR
jgi:hypothetical protein